MEKQQQQQQQQQRQQQQQQEDNLLTKPKVHNIKFGFKFADNSNHLTALFGRIRNGGLYKSHFVKKYANFVVVKGAFVYTIFPSCGYVNVTGVENFRQVSASIFNICTLLRLNRSYITSCIKVHTITASGTVRDPISQNVLKRFFTCGESRTRYKGWIKRIHFNPEKFPAFMIFTIHGTVLLYPSKYVFVGSSSLSQIESLYELIESLLQDVAHYSRLYSSI